MVIAGADDITVEEYAEYAALGYQMIIYASALTIAAVDGLLGVYQSLKDAGHIGIQAPEVSDMRAEVEALLSLPEYQQVEAQTTEREFQDRGTDGRGVGQRRYREQRPAGLVARPGMPE